VIEGLGPRRKISDGGKDWRIGIERIDGEDVVMGEWGKRGWRARAVVAEVAEIIGHLNTEGTSRNARVCREAPCFGGDVVHPPVSKAGGFVVKNHDEASGSLRSASPGELRGLISARTAVGLAGEGIVRIMLRGRVPLF
jgi:hypothetical protein